jgi:hypothetical protein
MHRRPSRIHVARDHVREHDVPDDGRDHDYRQRELRDVTSTPTRAAISRVFAHSKPDLAWSAKHRVPKVVGRKTAAVTRDE